MLDAEVEAHLLKQIREIITSMLQALAANDLKHWLGLCKQVLLASNVKEDEPVDKNTKGNFLVHRKVDLGPFLFSEACLCCHMFRWV